MTMAWSIAGRPAALGITMLWALLAFRCAYAQPVFDLGQSLPEMRAVICPTLNSARDQALEIMRLGPADQVARLVSGCMYTTTSLTPSRIETTVAPVRVLSTTYDPEATNFLTHGGHRIPVAGRVLLTRVYHGLIVLDGRRFLGWMFVPDQPYSLVFERATGQRLPR